MIKIINSENMNEVRKDIEKNFKNGFKIAVYSKSDEFNRKILENKKVDFFIISEKVNKGRLKQRDSCLNHVLCKLAVENNIAICINFNDLNNLNEVELSEKIAQISQEIKLCKKYGAKIILINIKGKNFADLRSFLLTLGTSTDMAKYAVENSINLTKIY